VKERLLLDGIKLKGGHVPGGNQEAAALVVANLADAALPVGDQAAVAAGDTADSAVRQSL
jgi:hypothetical protein